jgi:putative PIN family toxin of toxin-antitoxin system
MKIDRVVIDTNVLISAAILEDSVPARARNHVLHHGRLVATEDTLQEFVARLLSPKFDAYVSRAAREILLQRLHPILEIVPVTQVVQVCRDSRDDKFLEAAVNGGADAIITGDKDLLVLNRFAGIAIVTPATFLERVETTAQ